MPEMKTATEEQFERIRDAERKVVDAQEALVDAQRFLADVQLEVLKEMESDA